MASQNATAQQPSAPWWKERFMWIVVGGPLVVVVAGFVTLGIAISHPDPVLTAKPAASKSDLPAIQGRNHAATPTQ